MLVSSFCERLKDAMNIREIKASEICRRSEILFENNKINKPITQPMISHYLKGTYEAKQDNVYALALILNVDEAWLMGADVSIERNPRDEYDLEYLIKDESMMPLANIGDIAYIKKQNSYTSGQTILFSMNNIEYIRKIIDKDDSDIIELISPNPYYSVIKMTRGELKKANFIVLGIVVSTKNSSAYKA